MTRPAVFIFRPVDESGESHRRLVDAGCDVAVAHAGQSGAEIAAAARGASALLGATFRGGVMDRVFLEGIPELRIVSKYTIGVDDVDVDAATDLGILVTHCPTEANWGGVAEGTIAMLLAVLKKVRERDSRVKSGGWRCDDLQGIYCGARTDGYAGITVGIVGLGRIGRRVADLLRPWRMRLVAHDPYVDSETFLAHGVEQTELAQLLRVSDVVTVHCNLTPETRGLIGASNLALMKPGAILINTARGAIVDLDALCSALEHDRIHAAALDVLPEEPPAADARVLSLGDKVLLFPHMVAANQGGTLGTAIPWATAATLAALRGEVPEHVYNDGVVAKWRRRFAGRSLL
jgi:phosphoglycerate dehydrogenase-like enzyme